MKNTFLLLLVLFVSCSQDKTVNIWLIGDSTMAAKKAERYPESGWGVGLSDYVTDKAQVHNHAANGRSSLSFINEGKWKSVCDSLQEGDFVLIQFGHNDQKPDIERYTEPYGSFKENIGKFIEDARDKGANPIVCSSIVRRHFDENGNLKDTHGDYIPAAKELAMETSTPYIDMEAATRNLVSEMGPEKSKEIYNFTSNKQDSTHLNISGASVVAGLFVDMVREQNLSLKTFLRRRK